MPTSSSQVQAKILEAVQSQVISQHAIEREDLANLMIALNDLAAAALPADSPVNAAVTPLVPRIQALLGGDEPSEELAKTLIAISQLRRDLAPFQQKWLDNSQILPQESVSLDAQITRVLAVTRRLLNARPDVSVVMDDLEAMKHLRGGPADATAFHDFHVLQIAFKNVWLHLFDGNLKYAVEQLYEEIVGSGAQSHIALPASDALNDVAQLKEFIRGVRGSLPTMVPPPPAVGGGARAVIVPPPPPMGDRGQPTADAASTEAPADRLSRLLLEIGNALNEPYAFDVFAPNHYNFGLMVTYRQKWEPGEYQAGDLVATVPLAPNESRKFTKRRLVKETVSRKLAEKTTQAHSMQRGETTRAESEIMNRATTATNFKMTTHGSFNIGIGSFDVTNEFGGNNELFSSANKKAFHEATLKAAEEYRLERSMEVDTSTVVEGEETASGEISNPNNEITVTYLFYELQRRFNITEFLYRVRPVIMVAQDVPEPHEIDEGWLVQYQWILARVLLDESFRPALSYLTNGFAGDEVAIEVVRASWEKQRDLVAKLEGITSQQMALRDSLRELIVGQTLKKDKLDAMLPGAAMVDALMDDVRHGNLNFLDDEKSDWSAEDLEANRKAAETRLSYVEQALTDAQDKLKSATATFEAATEKYSAAMQNKYTRHIAIDQLRVHVKQNILYYMQAIWAHEPSDQRYFRLYQLEVWCPDADSNCKPGYEQVGLSGMYSAVINVNQTCVPGLGGTSLSAKKQTLSELADIDNPIGYKGNYIIFPLVGTCPLTTYMLTDFINTHYGINDPAVQEFDAEDFDQRWQASAGNVSKREELQKELLTYLSQVRQSTDELIVPTGQLFIEALPGSHPLLEDFKLLHRLEDVRKVKAEVRHAELENLRLASRLVEGQTDTKLLEDPDIEKKTIVEGPAAVVIGPDS